MHILLLKELLLLQEEVIVVKKQTFSIKTNIPFISSISKINNTTEATGSLWNYYRDEVTDDRNTNNNPNKNVINSESFKYKTSVAGSTYNVDEKVTNEEGNEIDNPAYDAKKKW